ncbi:MAG: isoprenyl transferase [Oligoflexia bacterium]|nr:isoprenyl transferase [Oligoflexia bacterium]
MAVGAVPRHVAIIMDGNGRWAQQKGRPRVFGHIRGCGRVKPVVREADRLGIKALTLYAFSTENWSRPEQEIAVLWRLLKKYLVREADELHRRNIRFRVIGEVERLSPDLREVIDKTTQRLSGNTGLQLTFAVSYGARRELARAAKLFAEDVARGRRKPEEMNEDLMEHYLWTAEMGDQAEVDLLIRTSGEMRVSNFLLWQAAYAELYFEDACWPDFEVAHLVRAVNDYASRERRFGSVPEPKATSKPPVGQNAQPLLPSISLELC